MKRPDFVTNEDIIRWSEIIDNDSTIPASFATSPIVREVCYAGLWLQEKLIEQNCPDEIIYRVQFTAGKMSFGRDAWEVHQQIFQDYLNNSLVFEDDPKTIKN